MICKSHLVVLTFIFPKFNHLRLLTDILFIVISVFVLNYISTTIVCQLSDDSPKHISVFFQDYVSLSQSHHERRGVLRNGTSNNQYGSPDTIMGRAGVKHLATFKLKAPPLHVSNCCNRDDKEEVIHYMIQNFGI